MLHIQPFIAGLKRVCALGTYVGTALSQDTHAERTLARVMEHARAAAMDNPELLVAPTLLPTTANKLRLNALSTATPPAEDRHLSPGSPYALETPSLLAFTTKGRSQGTSGSRPPRLRRPDEPPRDDSKICLICVARHPDWISPGRGHSAEWCLKALGPYNPQDSNCPPGPADGTRILRALEEAVQLARAERESLRKSGDSGNRRSLHAMDTVLGPAEYPAFFDIDDDEAEAATPLN